MSVPGTSRRFAAMERFVGYRGQSGLGQSVRSAHLWAHGLVRKSLARTEEFVEADQSDLPCPAPSSKIFSFAADPNQIYIACRPAPHRGAFRDRHGRRARYAVDAGGVADERRWRGRRSRVVL